MKRIIAMMICFSLIFSLTACSDSPSEEEVRGTQITNEQVPEEEEVEAAKAFSMGETEGLVYENEFIGIGCTLEDGWRFFTDKEIRALNNAATNIATEEYKELLEEADIVYDMYAMGDNQIESINVNLEKVDSLTLERLNLEDNYEAIMPLIRDNYENMGYENITTELGTISVDGEERVCLCLSAEMGGFKMYLKQFSIKCDGYLANLTVGAPEEETVDSIIDRFYFID